MRDVGARTTKSNSNGCPSRPPSSSRCTAGSKFKEKPKERPKPTLKAQLEKSRVRLKEGVKRELHQLKLSSHLQEAIVGELRRPLQEARDSQTLIQRYEEASGRRKSQRLREAAKAEDRGHVLQTNGSGENLLDIAVLNQTGAKDDRGSRAQDQGGDRRNLRARSKRSCPARPRAAAQSKELTEANQLAQAKEAKA
jgi:hypothetical protein